jgi:hypothetical protein
VEGLRHLRLGCQILLDGLALPDVFGIQALVDMIAARRGRDIALLPLPVPASDTCPYGIWVAGQDRDYIIYEQATSPLHRDLIILHECSHILLGHSPGNLADSAALAQALPRLTRTAMSHILTRAGYGAEEEQRAEMLACLLLQRTHGSGGGVPGDLLGRIDDALAHPLRPARPTA